MNYKKIIIKPVITEKSLKLVANQNKYTFMITKSATKGQVKQAVSDLFDVNVVSVNVLKNRGRIKRSLVGKRNEYSTKDTKKAIVQLVEKDSIKIFEGGK